jgi:hypothetical protein
VRGLISLRCRLLLVGLGPEPWTARHEEVGLPLGFGDSLLVHGGHSSTAAHAALSVTEKAAPVRAALPQCPNPDPVWWRGLPLQRLAPE